jgi:hypothetical protein
MNLTLGKDPEGHGLVGALLLSQSFFWPSGSSDAVVVGLRSDGEHYIDTLPRRPDRKCHMWLGSKRTMRALRLGPRAGVTG